VSGGAGAVVDVRVFDVAGFGVSISSLLALAVGIRLTVNTESVVVDGPFGPVAGGVSRAVFGAVGSFVTVVTVVGFATVGSFVTVVTVVGFATVGCFGVAGIVF